MAIEFSLLTTKETPPGNFRITVPETGLQLNHYDYASFKKQYESHCLANNIPLSPFWEEELQDRMCRENMPAWSSYCKRVGKFRPIKRGNNFGALMSFLKMVKNWIKNTSEGEPLFESQEEANRRANICLTCPYNTKTTSFGCGSCSSQFATLLLQTIGKGRSTPADEKLGSCLVCQCALKAAVWVPLRVQQDALSESVKEEFRRPEVKSFCWKAQNL